MSGFPKFKPLANTAGQPGGLEWEEMRENEREIEKTASPPIGLRVEYPDRDTGSGSHHLKRNAAKARKVLSQGQGN